MKKQWFFGSNHDGPVNDAPGANPEIAGNGDDKVNHVTSAKFRSNTTFYGDCKRGVLRPKQSTHEWRAELRPDLQKLQDYIATNSNPRRETKSASFLFENRGPTVSRSVKSEVVPDGRLLDLADTGDTPSVRSGSVTPSTEGGTRDILSLTFESRFSSNITSSTNVLSLKPLPQRPASQTNIPVMTTSRRNARSTYPPTRPLGADGSLRTGPGSAARWLTG